MTEMPFGLSEEQFEKIKELSRTSSMAFEDIRKGVLAFTESIKLAILDASETMVKFKEVYYREAEKSYLAANRKLPGSARTKRLLKKRRKMVLKWLYTFNS